MCRFRSSPFDAYVTNNRKSEMARKLKLQMQMTVDGFAAGPEGQLDWMTRETADQLIAFIVDRTDTSGTNLLGRRMTPGFIRYGGAGRADSPEYAFAGTT